MTNKQDWKESVFHAVLCRHSNLEEADDAAQALIVEIEKVLASEKERSRVESWNAALEALNEKAWNGLPVFAVGKAPQSQAHIEVSNIVAALQELKKK